MQKTTLAIALLASASALQAQCSLSSQEIRTFDPWAASFYYPSNNGNTLCQYVDVTAAAPVTVTRMFSTSYDQAAGATTPPNQVGNVAEVRLYTIAGTHAGNEGTPASWTEVARAEMTIAAYSGDCVIQNFKDPNTLAPTPFILPAGTFGLCLEYIPTSWSGTTSLPQTNVPLLNPGNLSCLGYDPGGNNQPYPAVMAQDQFLTLDVGAIQMTGWHTVDATGTLNPNGSIGGAFTDQPNLGFEYDPDPAAAYSQSIGEGCYDLPFMIHEIIPDNTAPVDLENTSYTAILVPSANGGFYSISQGGIPYIAPPAAATNLTQAGAGTYTTSSSGNLDDATIGYTPTQAISLPAPGGGLSATEIGINSNGKVYFDVVPPSLGSFAYNGSNYGNIAPFRDLATQWSLFNTDLDPTAGGDIYVMEPSPNYGGVMIWWDNIPNWGQPGTSSSFSIEFTPDGSICNIAYGASLDIVNGGDCIVGFSAGNGEPVGAQIDWSAIPASPGSVQSGDGSSSTVLEMSARPVAGTTVDFSLSNLPAGITGVPRIALFALNLSAAPAPIDLGSIGMPGCPFHVGLIPAPVLLLGIENVGAPGTIDLPFSLPAAGATGIDVYAQCGFLHAVFPPNSAGITMSNALCMRVGSF